MKIKNNIWDWVGFAIGIFAIVLGIVFLVTPPDSYYTTSADRASFGGDFYTYQYDATRIAAGNAAVTANNIRELGIVLSKYSGFAFMIAGMLILVHYGKKCFSGYEMHIKAVETQTNDLNLDDQENNI